MGVVKNYKRLRQEIPEHVTIVLAAKTRTKEEISEAILAGVTHIGYNYVQEAQEMYQELGENAKKLRWHMIGHLQSNKINNALPIFDVIQTVEMSKIAIRNLPTSVRSKKAIFEHAQEHVPHFSAAVLDSYEKAQAIDKRVKTAGKDKIPVYIEINIGNEISKSGIKPDYNMIKDLVIKLSQLEHIRLEGLMTMGPMTGDPEEIRSYFRKIKEIFDKIKGSNLPNVEMSKIAIRNLPTSVRSKKAIFEHAQEHAPHFSAAVLDMKILSMGMSNSYKVAIEEGSNMVRLGTTIFGERKE